LIPFFVDEVLPGDTFNLKVSMFARLATPIVPLMDNAYLDTFFFFVPNRLVWDNWKKFCGEQTNPGDSTDFLVPQATMPSAGTTQAQLFDYMGVPTQFLAAGTGTVNALYFRAYKLIYNEWFRDQNLQASIVVNKGDSSDSGSGCDLLRRGKRHDYFTSCLPWPQKGPGVSLPLGTTAPVTGGTIDPLTTHSVPTFWNVTQNDAAGNLQRATAAAGAAVQITGTSSGGTVQSLGWNSPSLKLSGAVVDLSTATAATINSFRQAVQVQKLLERDARGGTRYTEIVKAHFGVTSPDMRLQRPEFLGGGSTPVIINPVAQTSVTAGTPIGYLAAFGTAGSATHGFTKSFVEHGVLIGLVSARADLTYQQGIARPLSRRTRYDYYWPAFSHLGEQAVLNKEIYAQGTSVDDEVFGYQERWAEYRYFPSKISGLFRGTIAAPLDVWHLAQEFSALPTLSSTFIVEDPPIDRVIAVPSQPHFLFDSWFDVKCARPMPTYSAPGFVDHF